MRMKKNCNGCKALSLETGGILRYFCSLGYNISQDVVSLGIINTNPKPLVLCPKPKTSYEMAVLRNERSRL